MSKTYKAWILKDERGSVYAPYGNQDFTDVVWNAIEFSSENEAVNKAMELAKKHHCYIQIIMIINHE